MFQLPIITTPVYGLAEQIRHATSGFHYTPGNYDQLAEFITDLAGNIALRQSMGAKGPVVLEGLGNFQEIVQQFSQILREAYFTAR